MTQYILAKQKGSDQDSYVETFSRIKFCKYPDLPNPRMEPLSDMTRWLLCISSSSLPFKQTTTPSFLGREKKAFFSTGRRQNILFFSLSGLLISVLGFLKKNWQYTTFEVERSLGEAWMTHHPKFFLNKAEYLLCGSCLQPKNSSKFKLLAFWFK